MRPLRQFLDRRRRPETPEDSRRPWWRRVPRRGLILRVLALAAVAALHLFLFPPIRSAPSVRMEVGDIAEHDVRAPFAFRAPRPRRELEAARLEASRRIEPLYVREAGAERRSRLEVDRFLDRLQQLAPSDSLSLARKRELLKADYRGVPDAALTTLLEMRGWDRLRPRLEAAAESLLADGIVDITPRGNYSRIHVLDPRSGEETVRDVDQVVLAYRLDEAVRDELRAFLRRADEVEAGVEALSYLLTPNLSYDDARTEERRAAAVAAVPTEREYARNERILDSGERVNREQLAVLEALDQARQARELASDASIGMRLRVGRVLLLAVLLGGLCLTLAGRHRRVLSGTGRFLVLVVLLSLHLVLSWVCLRQDVLGPVTVPVVLLAMLATVLFGEGAGARVSGAGVLLLAILPGRPAADVVIWVVTAVVALRSVRRVRNRNQFYKAIGAVTAAYVLTVVGLGLGQAENLESLLRPVLLGVGSGIVSTALTLFLLPVFESVFEITTDLTLLELSDLNHPLLRRMSLESPGTYHHSQVVGTLAEAAAREIGANSLRTRVGANYHDIGKMLKPRYYVENQKGGPNAHDELSPHMSALVIAAHVKDGVELGRQWGLPADVTDFIPEHHGTSVMRYFYHKALEREDGGTVKVDDFRYPGPKPRSKETAIVMLADGVEAATRSLRRPTPSRIREMVRSIIHRRMEEGELDDCGLTMRDLARIREAFIPILVGIHHQRVAYPGQKEHEEQKEKESLEARSQRRRGQGPVASAP